LMLLDYLIQLLLMQIIRNNKKNRRTKRNKL
jgi:hypothetical protein